MILLKFYRKGLVYRGPQHTRSFSNNIANDYSLIHLCKSLNISETKAQYLCLKHPVVKKLSESKLQTLVNTIHDLGYPRKALIEEPLLFSMLPVTLKFRHAVLRECAIENLSTTHIVSYLTIMKQMTIGELKRSGELPSLMNIENRLAGYLSQWPTSLTTLIYGDVNECTLYSLRLKIVQRYLELVLDLTTDEFYRGLQTYPTIKHRPLQAINETLTILQSQVMMPTHKIKSNLYLIHVDPDNLRNIIYNFQSIGGTDIKEIMRMHPKLATKNYYTLVEIRNVLQEFNISDEAQRRCFDIYTLGPSTVRERLSNAKTVPEFHTFVNHPRFLKMIYYNKTAMKRLLKLYDNNKKCLSLNILSGSSAHYETFEKAPGDRLGKGKDLVFCISQSLNNIYNMNEIRNIIKRHPFWINIPLVQVKFVYQQLSKDFSPNDIFLNCYILLYPWNKIKNILQLFNEKKKQDIHFLEQLDLATINNSQKLSLVLYLLEEKHYFSGNGVWNEEKRITDELSNTQEVLPSLYSIGT